MQILEGPALVSAAQDYLKNTDFFVLKEAQGLGVVPEKVRKRRAEAATLIERTEFKTKLDEIFYTDEDIVTALSRLSELKNPTLTEPDATEETSAEETTV